MEQKETNANFKCGTVSIVGRPNVGKSTLLNRLVGEKVAIVSKVPQTTRNRVRGIYTDERGQIIFVDTPGIHATSDKLDQFMNAEATTTASEADCVIHLVDVRDMIGPEEQEIVGRLNGLAVPIILGLNKVDAGEKHLADYISLWEKIKKQPVQEMKAFSLIALSGQQGINTDKLLDMVFDYLPLGQALYPHDTVSDVPQRMVIADIIREKLYGVLRQELPHRVAVVIEQIQPRKGNTTHIQALVLVERDSQKSIVIGKDGSNLKKVGTQARDELEVLLGKKVYLEIYVKDKKNWRDNISTLQEMGYFGS